MTTNSCEFANSDEFEACQHVWPPHRPAQPSLAFHWAALVGPTLGLLGTPTFMGGEVSSGPVGVRQCNCTYGGGDLRMGEVVFSSDDFIKPVAGHKA